MKPAPLSTPALLPQPVSTTTPSIVPTGTSGISQIAIAAGDANRVAESGTAPLSIVARDPALLKEAIVSSATSTALPEGAVENTPVALATSTENEVRDWKGDVIPPEAVALYKTMADIMTGLGIELLYPLASVFMGGNKTSDGGIYVDFDYGSPQEVRTPYGTFSFGSKMAPAIGGIWETFDRLLHEAFTVVEITPRRNDGAASWDAFQHQLTGPVLRLYPKGTVFTLQRSAAEELPSGSVSIGNGLIVSQTQLFQIYRALIDTAARDPKIIMDFVAAYRRTLAESLPISELRFPIYVYTLRDRDMPGETDESQSLLNLARMIMAQLSCDGESLSITLPGRDGASRTFHQSFIVGEPISETPVEEGAVRAKLAVQMRFSPALLATFLLDCEDSPESIDSAALYRGTGIKCRAEDLVAMRELIKKLVRVDSFSLVMEPASGSDEKPLRILL